MSTPNTPDLAAASKLYSKLIATLPEVEQRGATMPYTSVNGHMFSFLTKDGRLALRLPAAEREKFLAKYKSKLVEQHGAVLAEYVEVPDALLGKTVELRSLFALSYAYVGSLKPKSTTRPKKAPAKKVASTKKAAKKVGKKVGKKAASKKRS